MRFQCQKCGGIVAIDNSDMGQELQCGHCGKIVTAPATRVSPGAVIADFIIQQELGRGGMGIVYLSHQISLDRPAALKVLAENYANNAEFVVGFIKEARAAAKLNHPHIVQAYNVGEDDGLFYFAMECIDGETMKNVLKREKIIPVEDAINIIQQIAEALNYAWTEQHLIHRDIKPDNIMLTSNGRAKLADLGLARVAGDIDDSEDEEVMGTPQYISPEHLTGAPMDVRSDIYSLGATFYHFVTGRFPFEGKTGLEIAQKHLTEKLVPPNKVNPQIPEAVSRIIEKMMAKNPLERYQDAESLVDDLRVAKKMCASAGANDPQKSLLKKKNKAASTSLNLKGNMTSTSTSTQAGILQDTGTSTKSRLLTDDGKFADVLAAAQEHAARRLKILLALLIFFVLLCVAGSGIWAWQKGFLPFKPASSKTHVQQNPEPTFTKESRAMEAILAEAAVQKQDVESIHQRCETFLAGYAGPKIKAEEDSYESLNKLFIRVDELLLADLRKEAIENHAKDLEEQAAALKAEQERKAAEAQKKAEQERKAAEAKRLQEQKRQEQQRIAAANAAKDKADRDAFPAIQKEYKGSVFSKAAQTDFKGGLKAIEEYQEKLQSLMQDNARLNSLYQPDVKWCDTMTEHLKAMEQISQLALNGGEKLAKTKLKSGTVTRISDGKVFVKSGAVEKRVAFDKLDKASQNKLYHAAAKKAAQEASYPVLMAVLGRSAAAKDAAKDISPDAEKFIEELLKEIAASK